jgi:hypothetical protein
MNAKVNERRRDRIGPARDHHLSLRDRRRAAHLLQPVGSKASTGHGHTRVTSASIIAAWTKTSLEATIARFDGKNHPGAVG